MARTPTYTEHLRVAFSGFLGPNGTPLEQWSCSLSMANPGGAGGLFLPAQADVDDLAADWTAFMTRPESRWHGHAHLTQVAVYRVTPNGKTEDGGPYRLWKGDANGLAANQTSSPVHSPQTALVVSLNKASSSRRHKGRVFLPFPQVGMQQDFMLDQAQCQGLATSFAQLVTDLNNWPGVDHDSTRVVVASTFGDITPVTDVRVGRRWDVMRSRANALPESYVTASVGG